MKSQTTLMIGCIVLMTCLVLGYYILRTDTPPAEDLAGNTENQTPSRTANPGNSEGNLGDVITRASRSNPRESRPDSHLVERFGEARTGLSKKITNDLAGVFEEAMKIGDMAAKMNGARDMEQSATSQTVARLARELGLSDDQRERATPIIAAEVRRRFDAVRELTSDMKSNPEPIMELFLYGDALAREDITDDEYQHATAGTRVMLEDATANIMGRRPQSPIPFAGDEEFLGEIAVILTPEQRSEFTTMIDTPPESPRSGRGPGNLPFQDGVPVMEIERLDQTVTSARSMTSGLQQMLQGLDGLQNNDISGNH